VGSDFIVRMISEIKKRDDLLKKMANAKRLYGNNVGSKIISAVSKLMRKGERPFKWSHEALGLWKEKAKGVEYL